MIRRTLKVKPNSSKFDEEKITNKGQGEEVMEVDIEDVRKCLRNLKASSSTPISQLKGENKANFDKIVNYVNCFYTSGNYESLHQVIKEEFEDCKILSPGTVAGYMIGSIASSDPCHPLAANSAPASSSYTPCQDKVLLATHSRGSYSFTHLNQIEGDKAILYIPDKTFPGLSEEEKESLRKMGVLRCQVKSYNNGGKHIDLTKGYISLDKLEVREGSFPETSLGMEDKKTSYNLAFILLIVIIVLILLFVAWKMWS